MTFAFTLLLVFLLVRYVLPRVLRAVLGNLVRQQVHKAQQQGFGGAFSGQPGPGSYRQAPPQGQPGPRPGGPSTPGQVRIDYVPPQRKEADPREFKGGEYVEYEDA